MAPRVTTHPHSSTQSSLKTDLLFIILGVEKFEDKLKQITTTVQETDERENEEVGKHYFQRLSCRQHLT